MSEALSTLFLSTIGVNYKMGIESDLIGQTNCSFLQLFGIFITKYGNFGPLNLEQNKLNMVAEWDPGIPIKALFQHINNAAEFAIYANHPIANNDKVQAAEVLILKTGSFPQG